MCIRDRPRTDGPDRDPQLAGPGRGHQPDEHRGLLDGQADHVAGRSQGSPRTHGRGGGQGRAGPGDGRRAATGGAREPREQARARASGRRGQGRGGDAGGEPSRSRGPGRPRRQRGGFKGDTGGFLYRPVPGVVTSPFGYRRHPIFGYWGLHDGTDFRTPCGTPNRAVASGTVISTYWSDVYGNRLYLDLGQVNGKNMTVVYNHLSSYAVSTGEHVSRGEVIGYAGSTGWSTACHLHFTVMLDGAPVDPMGYL